MTELYGQEHVDRYRATDGVEGHDWRGTQTLLLTTNGRKSGEPRTTPLIYGAERRRRAGRRLQGRLRHAAGLVPATSRHDPEVEVQIKGDRFHARARDATPEEKPELWRTMVGQWPKYDSYQETHRARDPGRRARARRLTLRPLLTRRAR